jgi:hypothetical protein
MESGCALDLGTLAFHESFTECPLWLACYGERLAEEVDEVDAHGVKSCAVQPHWLFPGSQHAVTVR